MIVDVGSWAFLGIGMIILGGAAWRIYRFQELKATIILPILAFGFMVAGVGVYGLPFFDKSREFMQLFLQFQTERSTESRSAAQASLLRRMSDPDIPDAQKELAARVMLDDPAVGLPKELESAIANAAEGQDKQRLVKLQEDFDLRVLDAARWVQAVTSRPALAETEPFAFRAAQTLRPLMVIPVERLIKLGVTREQVGRYERRLKRGRS